MIILSTWEGAYRIFNWRTSNIPAPSQVLDATFNLLNVKTGFGEPLHKGWPSPPADGTALSGDTLRSPLLVGSLLSIRRLAVGFAISLVLGAGLGVLMWRWNELDEFLGPLFLGLQTLPSACWVPMAILVFGVNENGVLFVLVMGSFFAIAIALRDGLKTIPSIYQRAGLMLGARGWKMYRYILLPAILPALASSLRQGFSFAWRSLMGGEFILITQRQGLGNLLHQSRGVTNQVIAIMVVMVLIGMLADRFVFAVLQRRVRDRFGLA